MTTTSPVTSPAVPSTSSTSTTPSSTAGQQQLIGNNFNSFLQLLTTQLQNQDPLSPLDTNQFTQQLVQFSQVEQLLNMNSSLNTLISLQKASQSSDALNYVGANVVASGGTAQLTGGQATWSFSAAKPATATITITNASGQLVYSQNTTVSAGAQSFNWNGLDSNGKRQPDGAYTISVTAQDATGQPVSVSTDVQGVVSSVDMTQTPPLLMIGSQSFTLDQIKQVISKGG
jgi:flagellar basal-body rod modification protein FlgD